MKYIGNKERLLSFIDESLKSSNIQINNINVIDLFAGTGSVSKFFKQNNCNVYSCDFMTYSIAEMYRTLFFNKEPDFKELNNLENVSTLDEVLDLLNNLKGEQGYFYQNYAPSGSAKRQYFTNENAMKIDSIREKIDEWKNVLPYSKYMLLIGILVNAADFVSNTAGTYGAYLKIWRSMAKKRIVLKKPEFINGGKANIFQDDVINFVNNIDTSKFDITYLDPPYNERQYASYFHVLERIVLNDKAVLTTKTGVTKNIDKKSNYCIKSKVFNELTNLIDKIKSKYIVMSYSTEGLISINELKNIFDKYGATTIYRTSYRRFKTNSLTNANTNLKEILIICKRY